MKWWLISDDVFWVVSKALMDAAAIAMLAGEKEREKRTRKAIRVLSSGRHATDEVPIGDGLNVDSPGRETVPDVRPETPGPSTREPRTTTATLDAINAVQYCPVWKGDGNLNEAGRDCDGCAAADPERAAACRALFDTEGKWSSPRI